MAVKVGINGFGRIGRNVVRAGLHNSDVEFVAVNDLTDTATLAHLLKYDSVLGVLPETVTHDASSITVAGKTIKVFAVKDPAELDWTSVGAQVVIESTGRFTDAKDASKHLRGCVKKVIISAPRRMRTSPSCSASTTTCMTRPSTTSSPMRPALLTAWRRLPRCWTK